MLERRPGPGAHFWIAIFVVFSLPGASGGAETVYRLRNKLVADISATIREGAGDSFLAPNERHPAWAKDLVDRANVGAYVTVGTERGFMIAGLRPGITLLCLADADPKVHLYNLVNIALLKASEAGNRDSYLNLRLSADFQMWQTRSRVADLDETSRILLGDERVWKWWMEVRNSGDFLEFNGVSGGFEDANYLRSDALFNRVQSLARDDKIVSRIVNFQNGSAVSRLVNELGDAGEMLSTLDLSNAWWDGYIGVNKTRSVIKEFMQLARPQSVLLLTAYEERNLPWKRWSDFGYLGLSFSTLSDQAWMKTFSKTLEPFEGHAGNITDDKLLRLDERISSAVPHAAEIGAKKFRILNCLKNFRKIGRLF